MPGTLPAAGWRRFVQVNAKDLGGTLWARAIWGASVIAAIVGALVPSLRGLFWTIGFGAAGVTCVLNAARSRRFHCVFTGPVFLLGALASGAKAAAGLPIGWSVIGGGVAALVILPIAIEVATGKTTLGRCC